MARNGVWYMSGWCARGGVWCQKCTVATKPNGEPLCQCKHHDEDDAKRKKVVKRRVSTKKRRVVRRART